MNNIKTINNTLTPLNSTGWLDDSVAAWLKGNVFCMLRPVQYLVCSSGNSITTSIPRTNNHKLEYEISSLMTWHSRNFIRQMYNWWDRGIVVVTPTSLLEELQDVYSITKNSRQINTDKERLIKPNIYRYVHDSELRTMNLHNLVLCSSRPLQNFLNSVVSLYNPQNQAVLYWLNKRKLSGTITLVGKVALIELETATYSLT